MISVIIPVYNTEKYLEQCLYSLRKQTFQDIEIICINDGSFDNSGDILASNAQQDNRIKIITQKNQGISSARNQGVKASHGEWIMFVDSDDWINIETCETAFLAAKYNNADVVFWPYISEYQNRSLPKSLMNEDTIFEEDEIQVLHRRILGLTNKELKNPAMIHSWGTVWGKLYKRNIIENTKFVDTKIIGSAEDVLFNLEVFVNVHKAMYIDNPMYHYRKRAKESFTSRYNPFLAEQWTDLYNLMFACIETNNLGVDFYSALNNRIALGLIGLGLNEYSSNKPHKEKILAIQKIITTSQYKKAISQLFLNYFPFHWFLFFWAAKHTHTFIIYSLLKIITQLRK